VRLPQRINCRSLNKKWDAPDRASDLTPVKGILLEIVDLQTNRITMSHFDRIGFSVIAGTLWNWVERYGSRSKSRLEAQLKQYLQGEWREIKVGLLVRLGHI
jgi:hypothetical protein